MSYRMKPPIRLLVLPLLFAASSLFAQTSTPDAKPSKEVVQYLDRFQHIIKKYALYADSIKWGQLSREVTEKSRGLATVEECKPVTDHILRTLRNAGDKHSFFMPKGEAASQTSSSYDGKQAESKYLGDGIGYLKVPEFASINSSVGLTFSQGIRSQLEALETQHKITGWVVDLRHNTGGNMHPMINGLQTLIGEGTYGYFIFPQNKKGIPLRSQSGKAKDQRAVEAAKTQKKVAVLIDSLTASSGEMVALSFRGLSNAKFFGQPSAGYTTINQRFKLSDGAYLLLATGYMVDKNRNTYLNGIAPDVVIDYSPADAQDKTIEAARRWLLEAK